MATVVKDLGAVTAYAYAVAGGYSGTEAEFEALLGNIAEDLSEIENLSVTVTTLPAGSSATASYSNGVLSLGIPKGDKGDKGDTGATGATGPTGNGISTITKTGTSGLVDTYTITFTNGDTTTFTVTNGEDGEVTTAQMNAAIESALADYAKVDGSYSTLTSGNAEQLVSTVGVEDKTPYLFRTTGGSADVGDRVKLSEITGGTVAWNQLNNGIRESTTVYDLTITRSQDGHSLAISGTANNSGNITVGSSISTQKDHVYLASIGTPGVTGACIRFLSTGSVGQSSVLNKAQSAGIADISLAVVSGTVIDMTVTPTAFDLTAMFGSIIADYLYTLESGTAGAGVAKLKSWGFCTKPYYAYDAGSLLSVKTSAHKEIGFNQWDEQWEAGTINSSGVPINSSNTIRSKNFCKIIGGATYYARTSKTDGGNQNIYYLSMVFYDADKNFISKVASNNHTFTAPANAAYFKFHTNTSTVIYGNTYLNDICINLHWDGERDGEYEPYEEHTYTLDSDLELRGIPKLDANNNLYFDGDSYEADGTVTRKYATRAYEAGDATDGSTMITDGTNTVYKLDTPITESADPYQETQICNDFGTEEFVDERTVPMPVGANALYQANLRAKLEMAPDSPSGDGDYIVRQTDGLNEYVLLEKELPTLPSTDGTYSLKCTVASGTATMSWVSDS